MRITPESVRVTAVVLSYNRPHCLRESLLALTRQNYPAVRIVVVDNRSPASGQVAEVAAAFAGVELIRNAANLGFTGGMNAGVAAATGRYVLLIEDDIVAEPTCIAALVKCLESHPEVAMCSGVMHNRSDGSIRCAGGEMRLGSRFEKRVIGEGRKDLEGRNQPFLVSYLPGALLLARLDDFRRWGGFREDFFMYHEDDELCLRILKAGGRLAVVPAARVDHFDPPAKPCPRWLEIMKLRNFFRLNLLHAPAASLPGFVCRYAVWQLLLEALRRPSRALLRTQALFDTLVRLPGLLLNRRRLRQTMAASVDSWPGGRSAAADWDVASAAAASLPQGPEDHVS